MPRGQPERPKTSWLSAEALLPPRRRRLRHCGRHLPQELAHLTGAEDVDVVARAVVRARAREEAADMTRDGAGGKRVEQVVIRAVVADPDDEVRRLLPVREDAAHVDALVHAARAHFDHALALEDLGGGACEVLAE